MAIKMRHNTDPNARCCECHTPTSRSLDMFDICIGGTIHTVCDLCTDKILSKTLSAVVGVNRKLKSPQDMAIIRKRKEREGRC